MPERFKALLFEDSPVAASIARISLPIHGIDLVGEATTLEEGLNLAELAQNLGAQGAVVDRDLMSGRDGESDGAKIINRLREGEGPLGLVIVEFSAGAEEGLDGIAVPTFGGHFAVPKDGSLKRFEQIADIIKGYTPRK